MQNKSSVLACVGLEDSFEMDDDLVSVGSEDLADYNEDEIDALESQLEAQRCALAAEVVLQDFTTPVAGTRAVSCHLSRLKLFSQLSQSIRNDPLICPPCEWTSFLFRIERISDVEQACIHPSVLVCCFSCDARFLFSSPCNMPIECFDACQVCWFVNRTLMQTALLQGTMKKPQSQRVSATHNAFFHDEINSIWLYLTIRAKVSRALNHITDLFWQVEILHQAMAFILYLNLPYTSWWY